MKDPEFIELKNRFLIGIFICLLFMIPLFIFMYKSYISSDAMTMINNKKTFVMFVVSNDCSDCFLVKEMLKDKNIKFTTVNSDTNRDYSAIMSRMTILNKEKSFPFIVYVEDGKMKANLFDINSEKKLNEFIEFHALNELNG